MNSTSQRKGHENFVGILNQMVYQNSLTNSSIDMNLLASEQMIEIK